jgi:hypothetical protein
VHGPGVCGSSRPTRSSVGARKSPSRSRYSTLRTVRSQHARCGGGRLRSPSRMGMVYVEGRRRTRAPRERPACGARPARRGRTSAWCPTRRTATTPNAAAGSTRWCSGRIDRRAHSHPEPGPGRVVPRPPLPASDYASPRLTGGSSPARSPIVRSAPPRQSWWPPRRSWWPVAPMRPAPAQLRVLLTARPRAASGADVGRMALASDWSTTRAPSSCVARCSGLPAPRVALPRRGSTVGASESLLDQGGELLRAGRLVTLPVQGKRGPQRDAWCCGSEGQEAVSAAAS